LLCGWYKSGQEKENNVQLNSDKLCAAVEAARADGFRPTIKAIVYDAKGKFVSFTSADYTLKMNFPGGGIAAGESPLYGFHRELSEETCGIEYVGTGLLAAPLLAEGRVSTTREKWQGKHLWLYAVQTSDVRSIYCRAEISRARVHHCPQSFFSRLAMFTDTPSDVAVLYSQAVTTLVSVLG